MRDPSSATLRGLYRLLAAMKSARVRPEELDQALTALRDEGHIPTMSKKRPMARAKGVDRAGDTGSGQGTLQKNPAEAIFINCEALRDIREVAKGKGRATGRHGAGHAERLFLASTLRVLPGGQEAIHQILSGCEDYDPEVTAYHIESLDYGPWRCETAQEYGLCKWQGPCANLTKRGGNNSPVVFAYRQRRRKKMRGIELNNSFSSSELRARLLDSIAGKKTRSQ